MNPESVYDLSLLAVSAILIISAALLTSYSQLPLEFGTAMLGAAAGVLGARSGRAVVSK